MYKNDSLMRESNELDSSIEIINDRPVQIKGENLVNKVSFKEIADKFSKQFSYYNPI